MSSRFLLLSDGRICLHEWGQGNRLLIALHGFEGNGRWFARFAGMLPPDYKLIAPDLPWHGQTEWQQAGFQPAQLVELINQICENTGSNRFIALGFSLGARLWFQVIPDLQTRLIAGIWLAPDGIASHWGSVMRLAALPSATWQKILLPTESKLLYLSTIAGNNRLLPWYARQFITRNFQSLPDIRRVLHTLHTLPKFGKSPAHILHLLQTNPLPQLVLLGTDDPLLNQRKLRHFFKKVPASSVWLVEKEGHALLRRPDKWAATAFHFIEKLPKLQPD